MTTNSQTSQRKEPRSITQEMHQAFADWVNKLPFIREYLPKAPNREDVENESSDKAADGTKGRNTLLGRQGEDR